MSDILPQFRRTNRRSPKRNTTFGLMARALELEEEILTLEGANPEAAKLQEIARPGEPIQLYTGMRTPDCKKILTDPVCLKAERFPDA